MFRIKNLSNDFISKIIDQAAGKVPQNILEDFLSRLESEITECYYTNSSESNLLRIIQYQYDISFFIKECLKYPQHIEILIAISNNSNYLSDILVRNPEYFFWIVNPSVLNQKIDNKFYTQILLNSLPTFKSFEAKVNVIRNFKRKEILRIGLNDISLKKDLKITTNYLSSLAVTISSELFKICYDEILSKYKIEKIRNRYVLFSLGKLGGNELNYSSDIDLIAFYDNNSLLNKKIYYNQILSEAILLFIETASKKTGSGFLYRVDFRLRPDGRNAPLCGSYAEYLRYYETRGEDWERQMLIKANFLCGSKNLYNKFYNYVSKFVFPVSFLIPPTEQIKKLKSSIEKRNNTESNIKLSAGGIRDIEFSLQALQLINGGKDISIRTGNSLIAIKRLAHNDILSNNEKEIFNNAYILYRKIEHYLQLMNDQQTHTIPEQGELAEKVAHFLGFKDLNSFRQNLDNHKQKVQQIFDSIMESNEPEKKINIFDNVAFNDKTRANKNLEFLRTGKSLLDKKQFDSRTTNLFEKIEDQLLLFLTTSSDPDIVLENFARIIKYDNFPQIWYAEFSDSAFFDLFLQMCEHSQKAIDLFAEDQVLRDEFLSRDSLIPLIGLPLTSLNLKSFLFRASVQITSKNLPVNQFSKLFTEFVKQKFAILMKEFSSGIKWNEDFFVAGMGSFGASQLSFASDIDLIIVIKNIKQFPDVQKEFLKLLQMFRDNLPGFDIDCRLRPEGKSSLLVWDINDYKKYFSNRARIWEFQAFTKCNFISGNFSLYEEFMLHFTHLVEEKNMELLKTEISEMRKKLLPIDQQMFNIKKSPGSLADIDFIITYLFLLNPELIIETKREFYNTYDHFKGLTEYKVEYNFLTDSLNFLKGLEINIQNVFNTKVVKVPTDESKLIKLAKVLGFKNSEEFLKRINNITAQIKKEYQKVFN